MFELAMGKIGEFWDKANRKLVGDEKMDQINAKNQARTEKLEQKLEANRIAAEESKQKRAEDKVERKKNNKQADEGIYPGISGNDLFNAIMLAAAKRKYSIDSSDKTGLTVTFQTPKVETFWDGKLSCFVLEVGPIARVTVSGSPNKGSTTAALSPGRGGGVMDFLSEQASTGSFITELKKFKREIFEEVAKYPKSNSSNLNAKSGSDDLPDQIARLKNLFDSGALSAEEFEKAKAKLLG